MWPSLNSWGGHDIVVVGRLFSCSGDPVVATNTFHEHAFLRFSVSATASLPRFICLPLSSTEKGESHWHSLTSPVLTCVQRAICRSGRQKDAPEHRRHSTGKRGSLSLMQIHTPIQRFLAFFFFKKEIPPLSLCVCLPHSLSLCAPYRQADVLELVEVERRFLPPCLSTFFPRRAGAREYVASSE